MNFLINRIVFNKSEAALKFTILKNKFLVPVKPKKALGAYIIFSNEKRASFTGSITEVSAKLGAEWKALSAEQKTQYEEKAKQLSGQTKKTQDDYEAKFVTPFKNINFQNLLFVKQSSAFKGLKIQETASKIKELSNNLSQEEKKKLQEEVDKIKKQREQYAKDFIIPEAEYRTERSFMINALKEKKLTLSEVSQQVRNELSTKYKQYLQNLEKQREQFAKKHGITLAELNEIISLNKRKLKRENENVSERTLEHLAVPAAPKKRVAKKTVAKTTTAKKTTAKRVATKKTAAKKTATKKAATKKTTAKKTVAKKSS